MFWPEIVYLISNTECLSGVIYKLSFEQSLCPRIGQKHWFSHQVNLMGSIFTICNYIIVLQFVYCYFFMLIYLVNLRTENIQIFKWGSIWPYEKIKTIPKKNIQLDAVSSNVLLIFLVTFSKNKRGLANCM